VLSALVLVGCGGNIVVAGQVLTQKGEPASSRLVVLFLNNQEVGRDTSRDVIDGTIRRNGVFTISVSNSWNFAEDEFCPEGQKDVGIFDIYRQYTLQEGGIRYIKLKNHDDVFAIKTFIGMESALPVDVRTKRLVLLGNGEVAVSNEQTLFPQPQNSFTRWMIAIAGFLITFRLATWTMRQFFKTTRRRKRGTRLQNDQPQVFREDANAPELAMWIVALALSILFANYLLTDRAADSLVRQVTSGFYEIVSQFISLLIIGMTIFLLAREIKIRSQLRKLKEKMMEFNSRNGGNKNQEGE